MNSRNGNINVIFECPFILNVGIWRKFALEDFKYKIKKEEDDICLNITYNLKKLYDNEGNHSKNGVNYKYVLYRSDSTISNSGYVYRAGAIKWGQTIKQTLKIYLRDMDDNYKLVFMEYTA